MPFLNIDKVTDTKTHPEGDKNLHMLFFFHRVLIIKYSREYWVF